MTGLLYANRGWILWPHKGRISCDSTNGPRCGSRKPSTAELLAGEGLAGPSSKIHDKTNSRARHCIHFAVPSR